MSRVLVFLSTLAILAWSGAWPLNTELVKAMALKRPLKAELAKKTVLSATLSFCSKDSI